MHILHAFLCAKILNFVYSFKCIWHSKSQSARSHFSVQLSRVAEGYIVDSSALDAKCLTIRLHHKNKIEMREIIFLLDSVIPLGIQLWTIRNKQKLSFRECVRCVYKHYKLASDYLFYFYSPSLQCSSSSVHPFTICVSWSFILLVSLHTLFLCDLLPSLGDHYVKNYLTGISGSWNSDPCIHLLLAFSLGIVYSISSSGCAQRNSSPPPFSLPCPRGSTDTQNILSCSWSSEPRTTCIFHQDAQARKSFQSQFDQPSVMEELSYDFSKLFHSFHSQCCFLSSGHHHICVLDCKTIPLGLSFNVPFSR